MRAAALSSPAGRIVSARQARTGASVHAIVGRSSRVAPRRRSIFSRMRSPPWTTKRSSQPARPRDRLRQRRAREHQLARPGDELGDQRADPVAVAQREQIVDRDAVALRVGRRHVDAAARCVAADVLPEIRELERAADRVGARERDRVVDAVKVKQQAADRVGRAATVVEQPRAVGVAGLHGVGREGVEQVREKRGRQTVSCDGAGQRSEHLGPAGRRRGSRGDGEQVGAERGEVGDARFRCRIAFVGDVVGRAREAVDRADRRTQLRRAEPGGNRELLVMIDAHRVRFSMPRALRGDGAAAPGKLARWTAAASRPFEVDIDAAARLPRGWRNW